MSNLIISDVRIEDRGKYKKVILVMEGIVTEAEARRCEDLMKRPLIERTFDFPKLALPVTRSRAE